MITTSSALRVMSVVEAAGHPSDEMRDLRSTDPAMEAAIGALDKLRARDWVAVFTKLGEAATALDDALGDADDPDDDRGGDRPAAPGGRGGAQLHVEGCEEGHI